MIQALAFISTLALPGCRARVGKWVPEHFLWVLRTYQTYRCCRKGHMVCWEKTESNFGDEQQVDLGIQMQKE